MRAAAGAGGPGLGPQAVGLPRAWAAARRLGRPVAGGLERAPQGRGVCVCVCVGRQGGSGGGIRLFFAVWSGLDWFGFGLDWFGFGVATLGVVGGKVPPQNTTKPSNPNPQQWMEKKPTH